jgi:hypothetical protein
MKESNVRKLAVFLYVFIVLFIVTIIILNPIMLENNFVRMYAYGLPLGDNSNPIYRLIHIVHIVSLTIITLLITSVIDKKLKDNKTYNNFLLLKNVKRRRLLFIYVILSMIFSRPLSRLFIGIGCGSGGANSGCVIQLHISFIGLVYAMILVCVPTYIVAGILSVLKSKKSDKFKAQSAMDI